MNSKNIHNGASPPALGKSTKVRPGNWVQTERKAHEAWAGLIARKPLAAILLHHLVAQMGDRNAVVISQKTLSKLMRCCVRAVQNAITSLVKEKWIQVVRLNGPGTVSAYVVNDKVAWGQPRGELRLSKFSATIVADFDDQTTETLNHDGLRTIPVLYPGERQLPDESHDDPPSQSLIPGLEPDLPSIEKR